MSCLHAVIKTIILRSKSNGIVIGDGVSSILEAKQRVLLSSTQNDAVELSQGHRLDNLTLWSLDKEWSFYSEQ